MLTELTAFVNMLNSLSKEMTVVIFGAGRGGKELAEKIIEKISFKEIFFVDNGANKDNNELEIINIKKGGKLPIVSPKELGKINKERMVIIISSATYYQEIADELVRMGFEYQKHFWNGQIIMNGLNYSCPNANKPQNNYIYSIDGFDIELPGDHTLPSSQKHFCYYDKILPLIPKLADNKGSDGWVIDIGANVGDSVYSMLKYTSANFLCVEADEEYYNLLKKNISTLEDQYKNRIKCVKAFCTLDTSNNFTTKRDHGTACKVRVDKNDANNNKIRSFTLKEIINKYNIRAQNINLIKVDTDGYDWECIMSMDNLLRENEILLYWENYFEKGNVLQLKGYFDLINYLKDNKYTHFFFFDYGGNYISQGGYKLLSDMNNYMYRIKEKNTPETLPYLDILACKNNQAEAVQKMLQTFYSRFSQ
jgi:FkbM family methyltransferase